MTVVAIAFTPGRRTDAVNIRSDDPLMVYYKNIFAVFASARRWNADLPLVLITPVEPPSQMRSLLDSIGVAVETVPFAHIPPDGLSATFAASLYFIDALTAPVLRDQDALIIDPDCFVSGVVPSTWSSRPSAHMIDYPMDREVNGLSARQAQALHALLWDGRALGPYHHIGGEAVHVPPGCTDELLGLLEEGYHFSLGRLESSQRPWFTTEEHLLSAAARVLEFDDLTIARRIWTARHHRTAKPSDQQLTLWHVPAEKERGLLTIGAAALDRSGWFWNADPITWRLRAATTLGLVPSLRRRVEHAVASRIRSAT